MKKIIFFCLMLMVVLFFVVRCTTVSTNTIPVTEVNPVDPLQSLQTIGKCTWTEHYKGAHIRGKDCREASPIYEWYINRLTKEVIEPVDPESIESTYKKWKASKDLQVIEALIQCTYDNGLSNKWTVFIDNFVKFCFDMADDKLYFRAKEGALQGSEHDLMKLRADCWKCKFIESYSASYNHPNVVMKFVVSDLDNKVASIDKKIEGVCAKNS